MSEMNMPNGVRQGVARKSIAFFDPARGTVQPPNASSYGPDPASAAAMTSNRAQARKPDATPKAVANLRVTDEYDPRDSFPPASHGIPS